MKTSPDQDATLTKCLWPSGMFVDFPLEDVETSIPARFEKVVDLCPDAIAIKSGKDALTYAELNARANQIARTLVTKVVKKGTPIGLLVEKGADQVAGMFGILKSGNIFVPMDSSLPKDRIKAILGHSQTECLLTDRHNEPDCRELMGDDCRVIELDSVNTSFGSDNLSLPLSSFDPAYIIYTSGSTGQPKGVQRNHADQLHGVMRRTHSEGVHHGDRIVLFTNGTSEAVNTIFLALLNGGVLLPFDVKKQRVSDVVDWLLRERISICQIVPSLFRNLCSTLPHNQMFRDVRVLRLTTDTVFKSDVGLFKRHFSPTCLMANGLGSSEAGAISQFLVNHDTEIEGDVVPVGYPLEGVEVLLLDDDGTEVGTGEVGEIVVRSKYLAPGYWKQPELTEANFKTDSTDPEKRLYYTGDLGLRLPDGCLVHKGRKDFRIKIRGYGVDLIEVEQKLLSYPGLRQAVVVARQNDGGESYLVGYFTSDIQPPPNVSELRMFLKDKLADYMIPSAFIALEAIPLTANGKIDRRALPAPDTSRPHLEAAYIAPESFYEKKLVNIWEEVLNLRPIGVHDDFFDLGGDSLLGSKIVAQLERELQVEIPVGWLLELRTIAVFAKQLNLSIDGNSQVSSERFINLYHSDSDKQLFCFPHAGGFRNEYSRFVKLAQLIGATYSFYGLRALGTDGKSRPFDRVEEMAREYVETIRSIQPKGPYIIIAECDGAVEAYETARQLAANGERIRLLAFFDGHLSLHKQLGRRILGRYRERLLDVKAFGSFVIQGMANTVRQMQQLNGRQRMRHLINKLRRVYSIKTEAMLVVSSRRAPVNIDPKLLNRQIMRHLKRAGEYHKQAVLRYRRPGWFRRVPPFSGKITLFVNEEWYLRNPTLGWESVQTGGIEVHKITGNHLTYITTHMECVAEKFKESLEKADFE